MEINKVMRKKIITTAVLLAVYGAFIFWYGGSGTPMTDQEVETLIKQMKENGREANKPDSEMVKEFRELCKSDDGDEFYMVNLIRYKKEVVNGVDPMEENEKYSKAIVPLLLKHGSHPVFMSSYKGRFIHPEGNDDWDDIAIIRYRSRKDMLKMAADAAKLNLGDTKFAAIEKTQVFPVKASITAVPVKLLATILLILFIGVILLLLRKK